MKKFLILTLLFLPFFMSAENLYYYSNGKKIILSEASGYTFVADKTTKSVNTFAKNLNFMLRHENIYLFNRLSSKNLKELEKNGKILPAYKRNGKEKVFASGRVFVKIDGVSNTKDAEKWCKKNGLTFIKEFKYAPNWYLAETDGNPVKKSVELVEKKITSQAEPSFFVKFEERTYIPNDPLFSNQWHLYNDGTNPNVSGSDSTHVAEAWDLLRALKGELGGSTVKLAIVDDGFDLTHEDFQGRFLPGYDFADGDDNPMPGNQNTMNPDMHGTSVAGVAGGATDNGIGIAGACPNCQLIPIRMNMNTYSLDSSAIECFEWAADAGADIISNSWGPADNSGQTVDMNQTLKDLVANITTTGRNGLGTIILFAAGNGGESIETDGYASNPNVFAIGASNASGNRASYSDFGNSLDFMASSCDIDSSGGDGWAGGGSYVDGIWTTDNMGSGGYNSGNMNDGDALGNYTNSFGGTSSACPLAAGITGLVLFANPDLTKDQVYEIYKETSDKIGFDAYDVNGFNMNYGYGRINACEAVKKALEMAGTNVSGIICGQDITVPDPADTADSGDSDISDTADTTDTADSETDSDVPDDNNENNGSDTQKKIAVDDDSGCSISLL